MHTQVVLKVGGGLPTNTLTNHGNAYTGGTESEEVLPTSTVTYYGKAFTGGAESRGGLNYQHLDTKVAMHTQVVLLWQCIHRWH